MRDPGLDEPDGRTIAREAPWYAAMVVVAGLAFVAFRVLKDGPAVLGNDPRAALREQPAARDR